jgi:hypothetical protein
MAFTLIWSPTARLDLWVCRLRAGARLSPFRRRRHPRRAGTHPMKACCFTAKDAKERKGGDMGSPVAVGLRQWNSASSSLRAPSRPSR